MSAYEQRSSRTTLIIQACLSNNSQSSDHISGCVCFPLNVQLIFLLFWGLGSEGHLDRAFPMTWDTESLLLHKYEWF